MHLPPEYQGVKQQILTTLSMHTSTTAEEMARLDLGKELNFEPLIPAFGEVIRMCKLLETVVAADPPYGLLCQINNDLHHIPGYNQIRSFSIHVSNPVNQRNQLIDSYKSHASGFTQQVAPIIASAQATASQNQSYSIQLKEAVDSATSAAKEVQELLRTTRESAQKVGVSRHAKHFAEQAKEHRRWAWGWLTATVLTTAVTGGVLYCNYVKTHENTSSLDTSQSLQLAIAKLAIFSVLVSSIIWCGRSYKAHRHNYVVNRHRQNALSSFETFAKSTNDDQTKNAVLLQATKCIFEPQTSGYMTSDSDSGGTSQIIEIVKNIGSSAKP